MSLWLQSNLLNHTAICGIKLSFETVNMHQWHSQCSLYFLSFHSIQRKIWSVSNSEQSPLALLIIVLYHNGFIFFFAHFVDKLMLKLLMYLIIAVLSLTSIQMPFTVFLALSLQNILILSSVFFSWLGLLFQIFM